MSYVKLWLSAAAAVYLSACSSASTQQYLQLQNQNAQKVMIVVHTDTAVPDSVLQAFNQQVPLVAAAQGFRIIDVQQLMLTEVPVMSEVDLVLYVDIQQWSEQEELLSAKNSLALEYKLVSAVSDQTLWHYKTSLTDSRLVLAEKLLPEALYQAFFQASGSYEQQASSVTEQALSEIPDSLAANRR
jgi:hypothetical protein